MSLDYELDGDGRVVVLSGSLGATRAMWDAQVEALRGRFRVVRYDHPGHGSSRLGDFDGMPSLARRVVDLLDELDISRASFVGLSLGGAVGMQLGLDAPDRLDRLVLACTSPRFGDRKLWEARIALVRSGGMAAAADVLLPRWFTPAFEDVQPFRAMLLAVPPETYVRYCEMLRELDLTGRLGGIRAPTLAIAGAEDPTSPPAAVEAMAAEIPDAGVVMIDGAAHLANVEQAEPFNDALVAHLTA
jgi:3-oxoadipate enol-lactonase